MDIMLPFKLLEKKFCMVHFFSYTIWQKTKNKIGIFFLTFFSQLLLFLFFFFALKVRVVMRFTAQTRGCLKCKVSPRLACVGGRMYGRFCQIQNFLDAY